MTMRQGRRRAGLVLLLIGLLLAIGGFLLPWIDVTCSANCIDSPPLGARAPLGAFGLFWPLWLLAAVAAFFMAWQEGLPTRERSALPASLLAGLVLLVQALTLLILSIRFPHPTTPVLTTTVTPLSAVSPLGAVLIGLGGWLRYHPRRLETIREIAEVPPER
jgi:hypothetical protein